MDIYVLAGTGDTYWIPMGILLGIYLVSKNEDDGYVDDGESNDWWS